MRPHILPSSFQSPITPLMNPVWARKRTNKYVQAVLKPPCANFAHLVCTKHACASLIDADLSLTKDHRIPGRLCARGWRALYQPDPMARRPRSSSPTIDEGTTRIRGYPKLRAACHAAIGVYSGETQFGQPCVKFKGRPAPLITVLVECATDGLRGM